MLYILLEFFIFSKPESVHINQLNFPLGKKRFYMAYRNNAQSKTVFYIMEQFNKACLLNKLNPIEFAGQLPHHADNHAGWKQGSALCQRYIYMLQRKFILKGKLFS